MTLLISPIIPQTGGFECSCNDGYSGDGFTCSDSDECASNPCDANASCANSDGGFTCTCDSGYSGDGFSCSDVDECASSPCDANASCNNTQGLWRQTFFINLFHTFIRSHFSLINFVLFS